MAERLHLLVALAVLGLSFPVTASPKVEGDLTVAALSLRPEGAHLSVGEALLIADAAFFSRFRNAGIEAEDFEYSCKTTQGCTWGFTYAGVPSVWNGKIVRVSMTIFVLVDDRTRTTDILPHIFEPQPPN